MAVALTFLELSSRLRTWTPLVQQLRYRNRPNLKRPLPMHYQRKKMLAVAEPVLPPKPKVCGNALEIAKNEDPMEDNPYAVFLAGQMRRDFASAGMVAILHYNHYTQHELMHIRGMLFDTNFGMKIREEINYRVAAYALQGTRWEPVVQLCESKTAFGYCSDSNVPKLLRVLKKMPQFLLLGLVYENRLLHRDDVDRVAKISGILSLQSQVSHTLGIPTTTLSQSLMAGQIALSHSLSTLTKDLNKDDTSSSSSSSSSSESDSDSD